MPLGARDRRSRAGRRRRHVGREPRRGRSPTRIAVDRVAASTARSCGSGCGMCPRHVARELDHAAIRGYKAPPSTSISISAGRDARRTVGVGAPGRRQTLPELVRDYLETSAAARQCGAGGVRPSRHGADRSRRARAGRDLMQIHRLRLRNFRQHENTDLELGAGLTGIIGPNGAGKTTILEAIAWAMYGMPAARGSRETIRRRGAPAARAGRGRARVHPRARTSTASSARSTAPSCIRTAIRRRSPIPSAPSPSGSRGCSR